MVVDEDMLVHNPSGELIHPIHLRNALLTDEEEKKEGKGNKGMNCQGSNNGNKVTVSGGGGSSTITTTTTSNTNTSPSHAPSYCALCTTTEGVTC